MALRYVCPTGEGGGQRLVQCVHPVRVCGTEHRLCPGNRGDVFARLHPPDVDSPSVSDGTQRGVKRG